MEKNHPLEAAAGIAIGVVAAVIVAAATGGARFPGQTIGVLVTVAVVAGAILAGRRMARRGA
jgi:hypothetical protein